MDQAEHKTIKSVVIESSLCLELGGSCDRFGLG